jgi:hypothetical protein
VKIRVGEKVYEAKSIEDIELDHLIRMQEEAGVGDQEFSRMMQAEVSRMTEYQAEVKIAEKEKRAAPDQPSGDVKLLALAVWIARLSSGEDLTWADARKVKMRDLEFINDDPVEVEEVDPTPPATKPGGGSGKPKRTLAAAS